MSSTHQMASSSSDNIKTERTTKLGKLERTSSGVRLYSQSQGVVASIHSIKNDHLVQIPGANSVALFQYLNETESCHGDSPSLVNPLASHKSNNGKTVCDEGVDTHDILNEPGGFVLNLSRYGLASDSTDLRIHLGIRQQLKILATSSLPVSVSPGTITPTDDYAREIFKGMKSTPNLKTVVACLEINDKVDTYELKKYQDMSSDFFRQFIQIYPTTLTKFHVEIPGMSAVYLPEWKFLLDQQTCLQIVICNFGVVMWKFYENCIGRNAKTLERLTLRRLQTYDITTGRYTQMNWEMFAACEKLEYLKITCGYRSSFHEYFSPPPPTTVFLHENLEKLPIGSLRELHLGKIWVEPCLLQSFCSARPNLKVCKDCYDKEYYEGDLPMEERRSGLCKGRKIFTASTIDIVAQFRGEDQRSPDDKQLTTIVLALFQIIIVALLLLFVVIYFGHWRTNQSHRALPMPTEGPKESINRTILL